MSTILLADPNPTHRRIVELTLRSKRLTVRSCADGEAALEWVRRGRFDLVFADVALPGIDGYRLCRAVKSSPQGADTPVVLLAGRFGKFDQGLAEEVGYHSLLTKPVEPPHLVALVQRLVEENRRDDIGERSADVFSVRSRRMRDMLFELPLESTGQKVVFPLKRYQCNPQPTSLDREVIAPPARLPETSSAADPSEDVDPKVARILERLNSRLPGLIREALK